MRCTIAYAKSNATAQVAPELLNRAFQIMLRSGEDSTLSVEEESEEICWGIGGFIWCWEFVEL